jgi:hypothetical protein
MRPECRAHTPHAVNATVEQTGYDSVCQRSSNPHLLTNFNSLTFMTKLKVDVLISA